MFYVRLTPAVCRTAPNRTACDRFRFYSAWVEIAIRAFSNVMRLSNLLGSLQACGLLSGDPDKRGMSWQHSVGTFCVNILSLECFPRGERWGCAPQTAPKSHWLSGLSSFDLRRRCKSNAMPFRNSKGLLFAHPRPATLGYTERPARLQFMVGQVGLYSTKFSCIARQQVEPALPASRPQAARKMWKRHCCRVARAKRFSRGHCPLRLFFRRCGRIWSI